MNDTILPLPITVPCDGNPSVQWYIWLLDSIAWCAVGFLWFWHRATNVWTWCNGAIDTFHEMPPISRRTRITTICVVSLVVVAMWPLEILICTIWRKITHATNQQGLPITEPKTRSEPQQPPPPYDSGGAMVAVPLVPHEFTRLYRFIYAASQQGLPKTQPRTAPEKPQAPPPYDAVGAA